jgi:hypothetical protein
VNPFYTERKHIVEALTESGIDLVLFNKDSVPKSYPCAVILLESETGRLPTGRQFMTSDLAWTLFLVVNAHENPDPDNDLYELKEAFRTNWIAMKEKDFAKVEYYTSRVDGTRLVRIARIELGRRAGA